MKPQFYGVIQAASNIGHDNGSYTAAMFQADFPQFYNEDGVCWVPDVMLQSFISMANESIQPDKWFEQWRYACGLFVAHNASLYLKTYKSASSSAAEAAASGEVIGVVKSATLGDASVSYDDSSTTKATEGWGDLNATQYGQLLATRARLVGLGGSYIL